MSFDFPTSVLHDVHQEIPDHAMVTTNGTAWVTLVPACPEGRRRYVNYCAWRNLNAALRVLTGRVLFANGDTFQFFGNLQLSQGGDEYIIAGTHLRHKESIYANLQPGDSFQVNVHVSGGTESTAYATWIDEL